MTAFRISVAVLVLAALVFLAMPPGDQAPTATTVATRALVVSRLQVDGFGVQVASRLQIDGTGVTAA